MLTEFVLDSLLLGVMCGVSCWLGFRYGVFLASSREPVDQSALEREVRLLLTDVEFEPPHACGQHARVNGLQLRRIQSLLGGEA